MQRQWAVDADKVTFLIQTDSKRIGDVNCFIVPAFEVDTLCSHGCPNGRYGELEVMVADKPYRHQGHASNAILMLMSFLEYQFQGFLVRISQSNTASISLFKKLGFKWCYTSTVFDEVCLVYTVEEGGYNEQQ